MRQASGRIHPDKWDLARLGSSHGEAGGATWAQTYAARVFGCALIEQPEFEDHVREIRSGATTASRLAKRYVRRVQGRRGEAVELYLRTAAAAAPHPSEAYAKSAVMNVGSRAWSVDGPREPGQPQRNLRVEAISSIDEAALRVARRGAGRCVKPDCASGRGAVLSSHAAGDHCASHAYLDARPRYFVEIDRRFWADLLPAVLDRRW